MKINEYKKTSKNQTRMNVADIAEILLQRIDSLEDYCNKIEESTRREMKIDTTSFNSLKNDFKAILSDLNRLSDVGYPEAEKRLKNGLNEAVFDGERRLKQSIASQLNGRAFTRLWIISFFISFVFMGAACFMASQMIEESNKQAVYREYLISDPQVTRQFNEWLKSH